MNDIKIKFNIPFKGSLDNAVPVDISKRTPITVTGESVTIPNTELGYINSVELQGNTIGGGGTPEAPIAIQSVTSPIILHNCGKNILNPNPNVYNVTYLANAVFTSGKITLKANNDSYSSYIYVAVPIGKYETLKGKYLSYQLKVNNFSVGNTHLYSFGLANSDLSLRKQLITSEALNFSYQIPSDDTSGYDTVILYMYLNAGGNVLKDEYIEFYDIQVEIGNSSTTYEPYQGTTLNIPIKDTAGNDLTLCKVGTVYDSIYKDVDNKWYINKKVNTITFNGTEAWVRAMAGSYWVDVSSSIEPAAYDTAFIPDILSSHFIKNSYDNLSQGLVSYGVGVGTAVSPVIAIRHKDIAMLADFKTWLASNPVTVVYILKTPRIIELHSDTANALEKIITLNGTTNIFGANTVNPILIINANIIESTMAINSKPLRHELGKTISITETLPTQKLTLASFTNNAVNKNHYIYYSLPTTHNCIMGSRTASSITATGTNTSDSYFWQITREIPKGTTLTIKNNFTVLSGTQTPETGMIIVATADTLQSYGLAVGNGSTLTFTTLHSEPLSILFYVDPESFVGEKRVNWNNIQLERGYFPTEWQAYTDNNIFDMNGQINMRYDGAIMTGSTIENGALKSTYNIDAEFPCGQRFTNLTVGKEYVLSFYLETVTTQTRIIIYKFNDINLLTSKTFTAKGHQTFTFIPTTSDIVIGFGNLSGGTSTLRNIMLELAEPMEFTVTGTAPDIGTNYSIPLTDTWGNPIQMSQVDKVVLDYASGKYRIAEMDMYPSTQTALHGILCKDGTTTVSSANDITFETPYRFDGTQLGMYIWNLKSSATATTLGDYVGNATLTLYFDSIEPFNNATVYFDDATGMWATRAYCDGIAEDIRYNDDFRWDIKFDTSATSHTVTFTHWSVGDSEFRVNSVFPINGVFEIGHRYVDEVTSLSQSCIDNSKPTYGVLANTGLTQLKANEILNDLIMDSIIPTSGFDIEVYANGKQVQTHTAGESDYDAFSKTLSLNLTNKIDSVFNKNYYSYPLKSQAKDALSLLEDIMGTVGFTSQEVIDMVNSTLFSKLRNFLYITSPYINLCTVSQAMNKVCELAQMQFIQKDNGDYRFIDARPIYYQQDIQNIIKIPKKNQYVQFNTASAIPKNIITTVNAKVNKLNQGLGRISEEVKIVYYEEDTYVGDTKNNSVYQVSPISFDEDGFGWVTSHIKIPINKMFLYNTDYIGNDGYNNRAIQIYERVSWEGYVQSDGAYEYAGEVTAPVSSSPFYMSGGATNIKVTRDLITFDYIDGVTFPEFYRTSNKSFYVETISNWGTGYYLQPETVDYSKRGNGANGAAISLPPNELINDVDGFQEVIADNILKDYATGILTAKTTINCDNYYKLDGYIAKDWEQGQIIEVGDLVRVDGDNIGTSASSYKDGTPRYWRVTGRKFRKSGVPRIDLELMEVKLTDEID